MRNRNFRQYVLASALAVVLSGGCPCLSANETTQSGGGDGNETLQSGGGKPVTLYAGITHSETVPHVTEVLKPFIEDDRESGASPVAPPNTQQTRMRPIAPSYAQPAAQSYPPPSPPPSAHAAPSPATARLVIQWFRIPAWMAGTWLKEGDMTTKVIDLRTGRESDLNEWTPNRLQASWGHQIDSAGNVWHANLLPSERDGVSEGRAVRFVTVAQSCLETNQQGVVTRTHYIVSESNVWNNQPIDNFQQESLNHYYLSGATLVNSSSNRVFSYRGQPMREGHLESKFQKTGQFAPVASLNGFDLRAALNDYLQSQRQ